MDTELQQSIKKLSELYDDQSKDVFVTIYLNRQEDPKFIKKRIQSCEALLEKDEKENFVETMKKVNDFLNQIKEKNIAIFASEKHHLFTTIPLPMTINNALVVDSSPYIRPLARIADEWESFTLVLLNSHQAKIFSIEMGKAEQQKKLSSDIINKHKKGGWSQARFQRIRKGAIHDFFTEVREYLEKIHEEQIVLAGPGTAKVQFKDTLPKHIAEQIVDIIDIDINNEDEIIKQSLALISGNEEQKSENTVKHLKEEILKNGLAVYGFEDTLQAAQNGQIDVLVVEKDFHLKGCLCEHCQILKSGPVKDCPVCGNSTTEADMIEEIIEFAERTDATIEFTNDEEMQKLGHIGGLLRYRLK
jgi:peptide chain release factor subunit 1